MNDKTSTEPEIPPTAAPPAPEFDGSKLPEIAIPEVPGSLARPSNLPTAAGVAMGQGGALIKNLEEALKVCEYLVRTRSVGPDWTAGHVFQAMQTGMEHGLGMLGGLQAFVLVEGNLSWRGKAAVAKMRTSRFYVPGTLDFGTEPDPENPQHVRGFARAQRKGEKLMERHFTYADASAAGLVGNPKKQNWIKYYKRMVMWRPVGFLATDLFSDDLMNFPVAEAIVASLDALEAMEVGRPWTPSSTPLLGSSPGAAGATMETDPLFPEAVDAPGFVPPSEGIPDPELAAAVARFSEFETDLHLDAFVRGLLARATPEQKEFINTNADHARQYFGMRKP